MHASQTPGLDLAPPETTSVESQPPGLVNGDLAPTSTLIPGGATAEVARRQPDGSWLWMIDQPNVLKSGHESPVIALWA